MARWRIERKPADLLGGRDSWWLMSGTNTLGVIYGERTARSIVADHNDMEAAARDVAAERAEASGSSS